MTKRPVNKIDPVKLGEMINAQNSKYTKDQVVANIDTTTINEVFAYSMEKEYERPFDDDDDLGV